MAAREFPEAFDRLGYLCGRIEKTVEKIKAKGPAFEKENKWAAYAGFLEVCIKDIVFTAEICRERTRGI